jgi:hypothetical protein
MIAKAEQSKYTVVKFSKLIMSASGNNEQSIPSFGTNSFQYFNEDELGRIVKLPRTTKASKEATVADNEDFASLEEVRWELFGEGPGLFFEFAADVNVHAAMNSVHLPVGLEQGADAAASLENLKTW